MECGLRGGDAQHAAAGGRHHSSRGPRSFEHGGCGGNPSSCSTQWPPASKGALHCINPLHPRPLALPPSGRLLQLPPSLDFGFVPTKETATAPLAVKNTGDVKVRPEAESSRACTACMPHDACQKQGVRDAHSVLGGGLPCVLTHARAWRRIHADAHRHRQPNPLSTAVHNLHTNANTNLATQVDISWKLDAPFSIAPRGASLAPGESLSFTVSFHPPEACSYLASAAVQLDSGAGAVCKVG